MAWDCMYMSILVLHRKTLIEKEALIFVTIFLKFKILFSLWDRAISVKQTSLSFQ